MENDDDDDQGIVPEFDLGVVQKPEVADDLKNAEEKDEGEILDPSIEQPFNKHFKGEVKATYGLPESIYSIAIIIVWVLKKKHFEEKNYYKIFTRMLLFLSAYFFLILSHFVQVGFIYWIFQVNESKVYKNTCIAPDTLLIISLTIFSLAIYLDLHESLKMVFWLKLIATTPTHQYLEVLHETKGDGHELCTILSGLTTIYKIFCYSIIIIPKVGIALVLLYTGCIYLIQSPTSQAAILHTLSLTFIIKIDDFIYNYLVPSNVKRIFRNLPPVRPKGYDSKGLQVYNLFFSPMWRLFMVCAIVFLSFRLVMCPEHRLHNWL